MTPRNNRSVRTGPTVTPPLQTNHSGAHVGAERGAERLSRSRTGEKPLDNCMAKTAPYRRRSARRIVPSELSPGQQSSTRRLLAVREPSQGFEVMRLRKHIEAA